jgi:hypothetical protein
MSAGYRVCRRCSAGFYPARPGHRLCWDCWRLEHEKRQPSGPTLDEETLRGAVALCHPDRHPAERREAATRITSALLEARRAR